MTKKRKSGGKGSKNQQLLKDVYSSKIVDPPQPDIGDRRGSSVDQQTLSISAGQPNNRSTNDKIGVVAPRLGSRNDAASTENLNQTPGIPLVGSEEGEKQQLNQIVQYSSHNATTGAVNNLDSTQVGEDRMFEVDDMIGA